jgi:hypothetical protein
MSVLDVANSGRSEISREQTLDALTKNFFL